MTAETHTHLANFIWSICNHVGGRAHDHAERRGTRRERGRVGDVDPRGAGWVHGFRETEVEHLDGAVGSHLDVRGLQIAVDDPLLVRGFERLCDLLRDGQGFVERHGPARDALRQIVTFNKFHHEGGQAPAFFETVDRGDVRMIEGSEHFGFALKTREPIGIDRERRRQDLDRDLPLEFRVGRPIHLPHPAFPDRRGDVVDAEARAGSQGHV